MQITIIGTVGKLELRYTTNGKAVATLSVAENHRRKTASGEWENAGTTWWDCSVWDQAAENAVNELGKGDRVIVIGDTYTEEYTRKDGTPGKTMKVRVQEVGRSVRWPVTNTGTAQTTTPAGEWAVTANEPPF